MKNLVVYGSLINQDELLKENISFENIEIIKVFGFKRVFNQEPSYRLINSINRAVLNIENETNSWFNAIVIKDISQEYMNILDIREKGYNRISIKDGNVRNYLDEDIINCIVYQGKTNKKNNEILPNYDYLNICLKGANYFGKEFFRDFIKTTYKNSSTGKVLI